MVSKIEYQIYTDGIEHVFREINKHNRCLESSKKLGYEYYKQALIFITSGKDDVKFKIKTIILDYLEHIDRLLNDDTVDYSYLQERLYSFHNIPYEKEELNNEY